MPFAFGAVASARGASGGGRGGASRSLSRARGSLRGLGELGDAEGLGELGASPTYVWAGPLLGTPGLSTVARVQSMYDHYGVQPGPSDVVNWAANIDSGTSDLYALEGVVQGAQSLSRTVPAVLVSAISAPQAPMIPGTAVVSRLMVPNTAPAVAGASAGLDIKKVALYGAVAFVAFKFLKGH